MALLAAQRVVCELLGPVKPGIKGLVHPKMKIKSVITHPHAVPTP